jgi:hypothetical protein
MAADQTLNEAVQAAIVGSAQLAAHDRISAATIACRRLGALSSGRWRAATRDLERMEEDLHRALDQSAQDIERRANQLGVEPAALWTVGTAGATFDQLRDEAADELEDENDEQALALLNGGTLFGVALIEDPDTEDQGTTLLLGWADPLRPAIWHWEATWVAPMDDAELADAEDEDDDDDEDTQELDLWETAPLDVSEELLTAVCQELSVSREEGIAALTAVATAFTRASLLDTFDLLDEEDEEEDESSLGDGHV